MQNGGSLTGGAQGNNSDENRNTTKIYYSSQPLVDDMEKPLICHFFRKRPSLQSGSAMCSSSIPKTLPSGDSADVSGVDAARVQEEGATGNPVIHSSVNCMGASATALSSSATLALPPCPPMMDEPVHLFPLTPSVATQQRHSKRSGRVLNESESMQEKHGKEYRFLVPWLAYAINCTIAAHEVLRQKHGLSARVSPPISPPLNTLNSPAGTESLPQRSASGSSRSVSITASTSNSGKAALSWPQAELYVFSTREVPTISVHDYLKRVVKYTYVSPSVLVCGCLYLDRLLCMYPFMLLNPYNIFKLFLASIRIASKVMDTRTLNNHDFSVVGGVTNEDLNALEFLMLELLQNRLYFSCDTFDEYCRPLRLYAAHLNDEESGCGAETSMGTSAEIRPGVPIQPTRPIHPRSSVGNTCSRRSSIISQSDYNMSIASQGGVSPLRSVSRPAFPPSTSTAPSISVDTESLGPARAPGSGCGSASTSARRHPLGMSCSPALPQVPHAAANGGPLPAIGATGDLSGRGASGEDMLRAATGTKNISQTGNGSWTGQTTPDSAAVLMAAEEKCDGRARSISLPAPRSGAAASRDSTAHPSRVLAPSTVTGAPCSGRGGGDMRSSSSAVPSYSVMARSSSQLRVASGKDLGPVSIVMNHSDRAQTLRANVHTASERVALPPVVRSRHRGSSGRSLGLMGTAAQGRRLPPPPDQPRA
ncbi:hypothetical protein JKF63_05671 [Porcisia hertigi]|uniref:Cyclin-like domain-containing protein n=1 Tax=Porcisia hertigi TaxID=2761500 RepID=A0A836IQT6_9TRYP|nr:hypothetical protein JKF63_05671 [Porcisia hertigi]